MDATPIIIKKRKSHDHPHHGGSWKVAYADFVTAMMAFFMVMWIMGLSDQTRAQIQGYFNDPFAPIKSEPHSKNVISPKSAAMTKPGQSQERSTSPYKDDHQAMKDFKQQLEKEIKAVMAKTPDLKKLLEHMKIEITDQGLRIEFLEDKNDFFESGEGILKPGAIRLIHAIGPELAKSGRSMSIEGHTDSAPFKGQPYRNYWLSTERANALGNELVNSGIPAKQILGVQGWADRKLRDNSNPLSSVNRRVTILLPYQALLTAKTPLPKDAVQHAIKGKIVPGVNVGPAIPNIVQTN